MSGICFKNICDRGEVGRGRDEMIGQEWNVWDGWWAHLRVHCIILFTFECVWNFQWQKKSKTLIKYKWSCSLFSRLTSGWGGGECQGNNGTLTFSLTGWKFFLVIGTQRCRGQSLGNSKIHIHFCRGPLHSGPFQPFHSTWKAAVN